jgi:ribonucleoside-diphosphate reductase alpha chain/ribonucleoside-triphosphate reductase
LNVIKRDNRVVEFDFQKIIDAVENAMRDTADGIDSELSNKIAKKVEKKLKENVVSISVETIQDWIEVELMCSDRKDVAKAYILYREFRTKNRIKNNNYKLLDDDFISQFKHKPSPMPPLGEFVYYRTYSRYLPEEKRREYWWETVRRAVEYNCSLVPTTKEEARELFKNMFELKQFLSGRTIWVGNTDVSKNYPMSNFNCAFQTIEEYRDFTQLFYLLLLGCGVGIRILKSDVEKMPSIRTDYEIVHKEYNPIYKDFRAENTSLTFDNQIAKIIVGDSKNGWVDSLDYYIKLITEPQYKMITTIIFNYDNVRPQGEKLKTFGGTASGHEALKDVFRKIDSTIKRYGKTKFKLSPLDCLDICNIIGEGVVVGGVRRTAEIALFDSDDSECINAKSNLYKEVDGHWIVDKDIVHRSMSNNSIYYKEKPTREKLHWQIEAMRYTGEPAFVNEVAGAKRRESFKGVNPCAEILLDSKGMCNLTTVNVMGFVDENGVLDRESLLKAQRLSARAGYRMTCVELELPQWNTVQQRDKLIGCSLTGWQDMVNATKMTREQEAELLAELRNVAKTSASEYAKALKQREPLLVTTIKPEGTLSQLPVVSSGVHHSHSPYFIRRIRVNAKDPIVQVCEELGYPIKPEVGQDLETCRTKVVEFPVKAPNGITKYDVSAIEQLENYKMFMNNYIDHNCSITVHVREHEWEEVEQWMWDNWDDVVAVSFLSLDDSFYELLPYEAIDEEEYNRRKSAMRPFVPSLISKYEVEELEDDVVDDSCSTGVCPVR